MKWNSVPPVWLIFFLTTNSIASIKPLPALRVYLNITLTSPRPEVAQSIMRAAEAWANQVNSSKKGLLGRKVEIVAQDNESNIERAVTLANKALEDPLHLLTVGPTSSRLALPSARAYAKKFRLFFTPFASHIALRALGPTVFQLCFDDERQGSVLAQYASDNLKIKKALIIINRSDPYSEDLGESFLAKLPPSVQKTSLNYFSGQSLANELREKISAFKPDLIFAPANRDRALEITSILPQGDFILMGSDGWGTQDEQIRDYFPPKMQSKIEKILLPFHWHPLIERDGQKKTDEKFAAAVFVSESLQWLKSAVESTQTTEPKALSQWLRSRTFESSTGPFRFGASNSSTERKVVLVQANSENTVLLGLYPDDKKLGKPR